MKVIYNPGESLCPTDDIEDMDQSAHISETPATVCDIEGRMNCDREGEDGVALNKLRKDRYKERARKRKARGGIHKVELKKSKLLVAKLVDDIKKEKFDLRMKK